MSDKLPQVLEHLHSVALGLFTKLVNDKQPFHLTLINVAFAKMGTTKLANNITSFFSPKSTRSKTAVDLNKADYPPLTSVVKTNPEETNSEEVPDDVSNDNDLSKDAQLDVIQSSSLLKVQDCKGMVPEVIRPSCAEQKPTKATVDQNSMLSSPETKHTSFPTTKDNKADVKSSSRSTFFSNKRKSMDLQQWLAKSSSSESEKGKLNSAGENVRHLNNSIFNLSNTEAGCVRKKRGFSSDEIDNTEENRYKRKVLCVNNDKGDGNNITPDVIPANIDESVFKELPVDIQNEIIRTCSSQFIERARGEKCKTGEGYVTESIYSVPEKVLCLNETQKESDRSQNRVTDILDSKSSVLQSSSSSAAASGVASRSDGVSLGNSLDNDKQNFTSGINVESEESIEYIPPNIDRAVFYTLPPDIKVELIQEWKQKSKGLTMKSTVNSTKTSTSTSESNTPSKSTAYKSGGSSGSKGSTLTKSSVCMSRDSSGSGRKGETSPTLASKPFFKMPKPSSTNNILSYFSKK